MHTAKRVYLARIISFVKSRSGLLGVSSFTRQPILLRHCAILARTAFNSTSVPPLLPVLLCSPQELLPLQPLLPQDGWPALPGQEVGGALQREPLQLAGQVRVRAQPPQAAAPPGYHHHHL